MKNRIRILATSDMHGCIYPYSYDDGSEAMLGLARMKTLVDLLRDENTLLLDNGDVLHLIVTVSARGHQKLVGHKVIRVRVRYEQGANLGVIVIAVQIVNIVVLPEIHEQIVVDQGLCLGADGLSLMLSRIFAGRAGAEHSGHSFVCRRSHNLNSHGFSPEKCIFFIIHQSVSKCKAFCPLLHILFSRYSYPFFIKVYFLRLTSRIKNGTMISGF